MARKKLGRNWGDSIKMTNEVKNKKVKMLVSGGPGSGKTHLISTAPNPFVIAAEDGVLTLHKFAIPYIKIDDNMAVYEDFLEILRAAREKRKIDLGDGKVLDFATIETLCLDSVWMLNSRLKKEILESGSIRNAQKDLWGVLLDQIKDCVLQLIDMDYHIIVTVGEAVKTDEMDSDEKIITYNFQGSFRNEIGYLFDFNLYMVKEQRGRNTVYKCFTNDENNRSAKARIGGLPKEMVDPSFKDIIKHLEDIQSE
jgi:hypothetical protein